MKHSITGKQSGASEPPFITKVKGEYLLPFGITPNDILLRHRKVQDGVPEDNPTPIMQRGNYYQDGALKWFCDEYSAHIIEPKRGYGNQSCNMVASLDGIFIEDWVYQSTTIPEGNIWECKLPRFPSNPTASLERVLQVQAQMDCADCQFAVIAEQAQSDCIWRVEIVPRHEPTIRAIREAVDIFWEHIYKDTDYPPTTTKEARHSYKSNKFDPIDLREGPTPEIKSEARQSLIENAENYLAAKRREKESKDAIEKYGLTMQHIMVGIEKVLLPDGRTISFGTSTRKAQPEKTTPATKEKTHRTFSVKEQKK